MNEDNNYDLFCDVFGDCLFLEFVDWLWGWG